MWNHEFEVVMFQVERGRDFGGINSCGLGSGRRTTRLGCIVFAFVCSLVVCMAVLIIRLEESENEILESK